MTRVFAELKRVLKPGGYVAFEVGEVRGGKILLESLVVPAAAEAGLEPLMVLVNDQVFTKTSNCWGVENLRKGTNTKGSTAEEDVRKATKTAKTGSSAISSQLEAKRSSVSPHLAKFPKRLTRGDDPPVPYRYHSCRRERWSETIGLCKA